MILINLFIYYFFPPYSRLVFFLLSPFGMFLPNKKSNELPIILCRYIFDVSFSELSKGSYLVIGWTAQWTMLDMVLLLEQGNWNCWNNPRGKSLSTQPTALTLHSATASSFEQLSSAQLSGEIRKLCRSHKTLGDNFPNMPLLWESNGGSKFVFILFTIF